MSGFDESIRRLRPELFQEISRQLLERLEAGNGASPVRRDDSDFDTGDEAGSRRARYGGGAEGAGAERAELFFPEGTERKAWSREAEDAEERYREDRAKPREDGGESMAAERHPFQEQEIPGEESGARHWPGLQVGLAAESSRRREQREERGGEEPDMEKISDFFRRDARRYDGGFEQY